MKYLICYSEGDVHMADKPIEGAFAFCRGEEQQMQKVLDADCTPKARFQEGYNFCIAAVNQAAKNEQAPYDAFEEFCQHLDEKYHCDTQIEVLK